MRKVFSSLFLFALLSGCLKKIHEMPITPVPCEWRFDASLESTNENIRWWESFNDPCLTLLVQEALTSNQDIKTAIARVEEYRAFLTIALAPLLPTITGTASGTRQEFSLDASPLPPGTPRIIDIYNMAGNVSFTADIWGQIRSAAEAAKADLYEQSYVQKAVVLEIVGKVAANYFLLRQYDKQLEISNQTYDSRLESYKIAQIRYEGGLTSELDAKQALAEVENALARSKQLEVLIGFEEDLIAILTGNLPYKIERGLTIEKLVNNSMIPAGIPSELLTARPDIIQAEWALVAANARINEARALLYPQITFTGSYGSSTLTIARLLAEPARAWNWGVNLLQPIFDAGRLTANVHAVEAKQRQLLHTYYSTVLNAFKEVNDFLIENQKSKELAIVQTRRVKALKDALQLARLQYENGESDYLNVLDTERSLFSAELDEIDALGRSLTSRVDLYTSTGGAWVFDANNAAMLSQ